MKLSDGDYAFFHNFFELFGYAIKESSGKCIKWNEIIDVRVSHLANQLLYFPKAIIGSVTVLLILQTVHSKCLTSFGSKTKELMILRYPPFY